MEENKWWKDEDWIVIIISSIFLLAFLGWLTYVNIKIGYHLDFHNLWRKW